MLLSGPVVQSVENQEPLSASTVLLQLKMQEILCIQHLWMLYNISLMLQHGSLTWTQVPILLIAKITSLSHQDLTIRMDGISWMVMVNMSKMTNQPILVVHWIFNARQDLIQDVALTIQIQTIESAWRDQIMVLQ